MVARPGLDMDTGMCSVSVGLIYQYWSMSTSLCVCECQNINSFWEDMHMNEDEDNWISFSFGYVLILYWKGIKIAEVFCLNDFNCQLSTSLHPVCFQFMCPLFCTAHAGYYVELQTSLHEDWSFMITKKIPIRAFSLLKVPTSAFPILHQLTMS